MLSENWSKIQNNRQRWRVQNKEDIVNLLEEVWCIEPEDIFYKIFNKIAIRGIDTVLKISKEDLESLTWKEGNSYLSSLMKPEIGKNRNII